MIKFLHTADIHLGKTYRTSADEAERYEDFFRMALLGLPVPLPMPMVGEKFHRKPGQHSPMRMNMMQIYSGS